MSHVKSSNAFLNLFAKVISFALILFIGSVYFSGNLHAQSFACKNIKQARQQFLKTYKQKQYNKAYSKLSEFMHVFTNSEKCGSKFINSQLWAYSDLALAALKMKDTQKCFQDAYTINDLVEDLEGADQKPLKSLLYNYSKCMELKGGKQAAAKVGCSANPDNFCGEFKFMLIDKFDADKSYVKNKCKDQNYSGGLDLTSVGQSGCLILQPFVGMDLESGEKNICPKLSWVKASQSTDIQVEPKKDKDGYIQNEILDDNNCCNFEPGSLSIMNSGSQTLLKMSGMGRDCYGGTASWFYQDIYIINFKEKKITLTENISVGLH